MRLTWTNGTPVARFIPFLRNRASVKTLNVAKAVWQGAVDRSPVASGELRASWNLSVGAPNYETVGDSNRSPGKLSVPLPPPTLPSIQPLPLKNAKYFVANGKEYASFVEYGTVSISPQLMLSRSVAAVKR